MHTSRILSLCTWLTAVACGSTSTDGTPGPKDAAVEASALDAGADAPEEAGSSLLPTDATHVEVTYQGGYGYSKPDGSVCSLVDERYTVDLSTNELTWSVCAKSGTASQPGPNVLETGGRTLTSGERDAVMDRLRALQLSKADSCGADKPAVTITIQTPTGSVVLHDGFYACSARPGTISVDDPESVLNELRLLAGTS